MQYTVVQNTYTLYHLYVQLYSPEGST